MSTEVKDPKETVRALIGKVGSGLDNPMLAAIAEAAPSPTAADHHITQTLGWPNSVGRVVRDMVRLRQQVNHETWKGLVDSELRPSDVLFKFNEMHNGLWFETGMNWAREIINRGDWPLFLREMKMHDTVTTYDGCGDTPAEQVSELNLYDLSFSFNGTFRRYPHPFDKLELSVLVTAHQPTCWRIAYPDDSEKSFEVWGKSVTLLPKTGVRVFPEFYKVLRIQNRISEKTREEIVVLIRRDFCDKYVPKLGEVIYRAFIELGGIWDAVLKVNYCVDSLVFGLILETEGDSPISICCPEGALSPNVSCLRPKEAAQAVEILGNTLLQILYPRSLQEILGRELIEHPPETLAELLVKK